MDLKIFSPTYLEQSKSKYKYRFSVFTPIYNRENTIHRVFDSLENQTFRDFELILINDGSTDNSHKIVKSLIEKVDFPIIYKNNQENKHKMACFFEAIKLARGQFLLTLDSDDECTPNALEILNDEYNSIPENLKHNISGVTCLCMDQNHRLVGSLFPEQPYYSNTFEQSFKFPNSGEKWGFTKSDILKSIHVNKDIFSKGLIPESYIWCLISKQGFKTKYVNKTIRIYYRNTVNQLSQGNYKSNSFGSVIFAISVLNWFHQDYFPSQIRIFLKRIYVLLRSSNYLNFSKKDYIKSIDNDIFKLLFATGWYFRKIIK
ncbi:glycosyltransferase family 2 protein [Mangrovimonas sp. TPBH4]|uniref:glycosyltransferase family 2 protein n=1 Tax=Mangrovimonas sp. TPBH4 TaxID=1645914 RepID=UPI0006B64C64|nr:glycosyltransferase family 2 protein [Mangrovimonas sp. TPBH4]